MKFKLPEKNVYNTDPTLEIEGIGIKLAEGMIFYCKRPGGANKAYNQAISRLSTPHRRMLQNDRMPLEEQVEKIILPAYLQTVIFGWEGEAFQDEDGEPVPFTKKAAKEFFIQFPDIFSDLVLECQSLANFAARQVEEAAEDLGNS